MPIEQVAPELTRLVDLHQEVEWLGSGFGADATPLGLPWWPAKGPVWWQEGLNIEKLSYAATCYVSVDPNTSC